MPQFSFSVSDFMCTFLKKTSTLHRYIHSTTAHTYIHTYIHYTHFIFSFCYPPLKDKINANALVYIWSWPHQRSTCTCVSDAPIELAELNDGLDLVDEEDHVPFINHNEGRERKAELELIKTLCNRKYIKLYHINYAISNNRKCFRTPFVTRGYYQWHGLLTVKSNWCMT